MAEAKFAWYCRCGGSMTGSVDPPETQTGLKAIWLAVHDPAKPEHGEATREQARAALLRRRRQEATHG